MIQQMEEMGVLENYREASFDNFNMEFNQQRETARDIYKLAKAGKWIILSGSDLGTGKTHLATAAMYLSFNTPDIIKLASGEKVEQKKIPGKYLFVDICSFGNDLKMAGITLPERIGELRSKNCLFLDEIGREPVEVKTHIESLFGYFYNRRRQIIATTPLSEKDFIKFYGGRTIDRIQERGEFIQLSGRSYRQRG